MQTQILKIMKKVFLSVALLGLFAVGTVNAQDQDKKKKEEQKTELKKDEVKQQDPNAQPQQMSNDEKKAKEDQQKQYDPNQQPSQDQKTTDSVPK